MTGLVAAELLADVLQQAAAGDEAAFTRIVEAYHPGVVRVAYGICGEQDLALDAAQATWLIAWRKLRTVREPDRLRSWLVAVAANEARHIVRRRGRRRLVELAALTAGTLFIGSERPALLTTEVEGQSLCSTAQEGDWSGPALISAPGSRLSNMVMSCVNTMSDERLSGDVVTALECEYSEEDRLLVGECWGTTTVRNEAGAWGGVFSGTTRVATDDVMESVWLGSGDYEGLRFVGSLVTATEPYVISGRVEPIAP